MERLALPAAVPAPIQSQFGKIRDLYIDGLFRYEHFTTAAHRSYGVLEAALKTRFVEHYAQGLPIVVDGQEESRAAARWDDVERITGRQAKRRRRLSGHRDFDGSLRSLLRWARGERYLYGQRNRRKEDLLVEIRNDVTHTEHDLLELPSAAYRDLRSVWEIICRLWETDPIDGVDYPAPVVRVPHVIGRAADGYGVSILDPSVVENHAEPPPGFNWYVVLAHPYERRLLDWRPGFETTGTPVDVLWGPGEWADLRTTATRAVVTWQPDMVRLLDRIFFVRVVEGVPELARSSSQVMQLAVTSPDERWFAIRADHPADALVHCRGLITGGCRESCGCPASVVRDDVSKRRIDEFVRAGNGELEPPRRQEWQ